MPKSMVSREHYNAVKLERDELAARVNQLEEAIKYSIDPENEPEYHDEGMGCGLEDRNITCRYEAMAYGWEKAIGRVYSEVMPPEDVLSTTPVQRLLIHDAEVLEKAVQDIAPVDPNRTCGDFEQGLQWSARLLSCKAEQLRHQATEKADG